MRASITLSLAVAGCTNPDMNPGTDPCVATCEAASEACPGRELETTCEDFCAALSAQATLAGCTEESAAIYMCTTAEPDACSVASCSPLVDDYDGCVGASDTDACVEACELGGAPSCPPFCVLTQLFAGISGCTSEYGALLACQSADPAALCTAEGSAHAACVCAYCATSTDSVECFLSATGC